MAGADQPKPSILGRTENHIAVAEHAEGRSDFAGAECRDIGADQHHRTWMAGPERALHPDAEIATALAKGFDRSAPTAGASSIRGQCDPQAPPPIRRQTAKQHRDHQPLETLRRDIADLTRQPALADAETRC